MTDKGEVAYRELTDEEEQIVLAEWADRITGMSTAMCESWKHQAPRPCGTCSRNVMWTTQQWSQLLLADQREEKRLEQVTGTWYSVRHSYALRVVAGHLEPAYRLAIDVTGQGGKVL